jgi:hypothetical protein
MSRGNRNGLTAAQIPHDTSDTYPEAEAKVGRGLVVRDHLKTEAHDIFIKLYERHEIAGGLGLGKKEQEQGMPRTVSREAKKREDLSTLLDTATLTSDSPFVE